jgi:hypothetical protein
MNEEKEFSVVQFFEDNSYEYVRTFVTAQEAAKVAEHYIHSVAAKLGIVKRVIVTDGEDYCCFDWVNGKGVVFPPQQTLH